jgi:hypothetical protein
VSRRSSSQPSADQRLCEERVDGCDCTGPDLSTGSWCSAATNRTSPMGATETGADCSNICPVAGAAPERGRPGWKSDGAWNGVPAERSQAVTDRSSFALGFVSRPLVSDRHVWQCATALDAIVERMRKVTPTRCGSAEGPALPSSMSDEKVAARASTHDASTATRNISGAPRGEDSTALKLTSLRSGLRRPPDAARGGSYPKSSPVRAGFAGKQRGRDGRPKSL